MNKNEPKLQLIATDKYDVSLPSVAKTTYNQYTQCARNSTVCETITGIGLRLKLTLQKALSHCCLNILNKINKYEQHVSITEKVRRQFGAKQSVAGGPKIT